MSKKLTKEERDEIARKSRNYNNMKQVLTGILDGIEPLKETAEEAFGYWSKYSMENGKEAYRDVNAPPYEAEDHPMFWSGVAYGIDLLAGYNCAKMADELGEEKIKQLNNVLQ